MRAKQGEERRYGVAGELDRLAFHKAAGCPAASGRPGLGSADGRKVCAGMGGSAPLRQGWARGLGGLVEKGASQPILTLYVRKCNMLTILFIFLPAAIRQFSVSLYHES